MTTEQITPEHDDYAGQSLYTPLVLRLYDLVALGFNTNVIWRCPTREVQAHYNRHVSNNHLDVGVGSGYFLDRCRFPSASPRLVLMDLNQNSLQVAAERVRRYRPEMVRGNVLEPIPYDGEPFDSIGVCFLLHCLRGSIPEKAVVFDHLRDVLRPGGVIFGATVLAEGVEVKLGARWMMEHFNRRGAFSNRQDSLTDLYRALDRRFSDVSLRTHGCAAIFAARSPRDTSINPE